MRADDEDASARPLSKQLVELQNDLVHAKQVASEASQARVEFLAKMSHEIRTPLNGLYGMIQLLETTEVDSTQERYLKLARRSAEDLQALVDDILNFSKTITDTLRLEKKSFSLNECVSGVITNLSGALEEKGHSLFLERDSDLPDLFYGDPLRLAQIISNLLSNAIKYTNEKGEIRLEIHSLLHTKRKSKIQVSIIDNGRGISKNNITRIFDPFTQAHPSQNQVNPGTGLGLAITQKLIELMNGKIWVESTPGEGSTFFFTITLEHEEKNLLGSDPLVPPKSPIQKSENIHPVLLVEDNKVNQELLYSALSDAGYEVEIARNGREAVELFRNNDFELILMDINMPEVDGITATLAIRTFEHAEAKRKTPIIALTAYAMDGDKERFLKAGMDDYIAKPVQLNKLFEKMNEAIS